LLASWIIPIGIKVAIIVDRVSTNRIVPGGFKDPGIDVFVAIVTIVAATRIRYITVIIAISRWPADTYASGTNVVLCTCIDIITGCAVDNRIWITAIIDFVAYSVVALVGLRAAIASPAGRAHSTLAAIAYCAIFPVLTTGPVPYWVSLADVADVIANPVVAAIIQKWAVTGAAVANSRGTDVSDGTEQVIVATGTVPDWLRLADIYVVVAYPVVALIACTAAIPSRTGTDPAATSVGIGAIKSVVTAQTLIGRQLLALSATLVAGPSVTVVIKKRTIPSWTRTDPAGASVGIGAI
jgi:hypothetical protein